jgi:hypothetical protein
MSLKDTFQWHDNSKRVPKDAHAVFSASNYHWINYTIDKCIQKANEERAQKLGTELHELAYMLIKNNIVLPSIDITLNMYVNDAILYGMKPEQKLYYSKWFFGTADAIVIDDDILRIHDLKTGVTKSSLHQLEIYAALFCLEYDFKPNDFKDIELRIYQSNHTMISHPCNAELIPLMDKIITVSSLLEKLEEDNNNVY